MHGLLRLAQIHFMCPPAAPKQQPTCTTFSFTKVIILFSFLSHLILIIELPFTGVLNRLITCYNNNLLAINCRSILGWHKVG